MPPASVCIGLLLISIGLVAGFDIQFSPNPKSDDKPQHD